MTQNSKLKVRHLQFLECDGIGKDRGFHFKKKRRRDAPRVKDQSELPMPEELFLKYGNSPKQYANSGQRDSNILREALIRNGVDPEKGPGNILEFGCANARVLRWFCDWAYHGEAWGVDLNAPMVFWCHQNLSPPFHFAVSTTAPSLFFEDRFFSLVFCMSIFTHIDDLYLSWLAELRRVTKPGGFVYITVHDENTHRIQAEQNAPNLAKRMETTAYQEFLEQDSDFCSCGRDWKSLISFRREYLVELLSSFFEVVEVVEGAMAGTQTAFLLRRL